MQTILDLENKHIYKARKQYLPLLVMGHIYSGKFKMPLINFCCQAPRQIQLRMRWNSGLLRC